MAPSSSRFGLLGALVVLLWGSAPRVSVAIRRYPYFPPDGQEKGVDRQPLQLQRPFNIAHRGSNGEIPEETAEAYLRAIAEGADFIESDITATKDAKLICFHDLVLDHVTNVADHSQFADRIRTTKLKDNLSPGIFQVVDFTLEELQTLRARQRFPYRDQSFNSEVAWRQNTQRHLLGDNFEVHPYTCRNGNKFLHFDFHQDPYQEYSYWIHNVSIDGLFTDFAITLHLYQEWTSPLTSP